MVKPEKVLFFGNQVSSIMLDEKITVSTARQKKFDLYLNSERFDAYAVYYPVGNGRFNQSKAVEDIKEILK
jgi:DNA polymerase